MPAMLATARGSVDGAGARPAPPRSRTLTPAPATGPVASALTVHSPSRPVAAAPVPSAGRLSSAGRSASGRKATIMKKPTITTKVPASAAAIQRDAMTNSLASASRAGAEPAAPERPQHLMTQTRPAPKRAWLGGRLAGALSGRTAAGLAVAFGSFAALGTVTALWPNPLFVRMTPAGGWEIGLLALLSLLLGFYVTIRRKACGTRTAGSGGILGFLGIACPVCNKVLLLLFGAEALLAYFEPVRLYVALAGTVLVAAAVLRELRRRSPESATAALRTPSAR